MVAVQVQVLLAVLAAAAVVAHSRTQPWQPVLRTHKAISQVMDM
jgi:hypothetical protein